MVNETRMVELEKGRLQPGKDGSRDFHFFWEVKEWDTTKSLTNNATAWEPAPVAATEAAAPAAPATEARGGSYDDRFRTKEELRWTEAVHMATRMLQGAEVLTYQEVKDAAGVFYKMLEGGPPAPVCAEHNGVAYDYTSAKGKRYHKVEGGVCIEGQGFLAVAQQIEG